MGKKLHPSQEAKAFLQRPRSRWKEFLFAISVFREFIKGFRKLHFVGPCVTIYGSARFKPDHVYYQLAVRMGKEMADLGFTVMTGGGPGVMEAANKGAYEAGGLSAGCNILLPFEQEANKYVQRNVDMKFFFVRKVLLVKYSYAFIIIPGGVGTLDELFETLTLIQTKTIEDIPVVLMGKEYWQSLIQLMQDLAKAGTIDTADIDLMLVTDDPEEAKAHIQKYSIEKYKLQKTYYPKRSWWLGE